ncbi:hypothetical protein IAU60_002940 [Kwoniella sp. DSM 27419]
MLTCVMREADKADMTDASSKPSALGRAYKGVSGYVMKCFDYAAPIPVTPGSAPGWTRPGQPIRVDGPAVGYEEERINKKLQKA